MTLRTPRRASSFAAQAGGWPCFLRASMRRSWSCKSWSSCSIFVARSCVVGGGGGGFGGFGCDSGWAYHHTPRSSVLAIFRTRSRHPPTTDSIAFVFLATPKLRPRKKAANGNTTARGRGGILVAPNTHVETRPARDHASRENHPPDGPKGRPGSERADVVPRDRRLPVDVDAVVVEGASGTRADVSRRVQASPSTNAAGFLRGPVEDAL